MKKFLFTMLLALACGFTASASHISGGEIYYQWNGTNYSVYLKLYKVCTPNSAGLPNAVTIRTRSGSLGVDTGYVGTMIKEENGAPQCSVANSCFNPPSSIPGYLIRTYKVDITMNGTASDWKLYFTTGARATTFNISVASPNLYIETTLDNTVTNNSNAYVPTLPPMLIDINGTTRHLQALDPDGDSVVFETVDPMADSANTVTYATSYSTANPLGQNGVYTISPNGDSMVVDPPQQGLYVLAYSVKEYRSGTLISSRIVEFLISARAGVNAKAPQLVSGPTTAYICPGKTQLITLGFIDVDPGDSVFTMVDTPSLSGFSYNFNSSNGVNNGNVQLSVTAPSNLNPQNLPHFFVDVWVYDNNCPRGANKYAVMFKTRACNVDSVWPGDANSDKVVNLLDPLAVALSYNSTGTVRANATNNWVAQYAADWGSNITGTAIDKKHADCDGNGTVGLSDLQAVSANWGNMHPKKGPRAKTTGVPDLYFDMTGIGFVAPGATIDVPVMLGDGASSITDFYGIATRMNVAYNSTLPTTAITVAHDYSWVGTSSNTLNFNKSIDNGTVDWAFARTDQNGVTNHGKIGTLRYTVPSTAVDGDKIDLTFGEVVIIDSKGNTITDLNIENAVAYVASLGVDGMRSTLGHVSIIPNPSGSNAMLDVTLVKAQNVQLTVTDITGKQLWSVAKEMSKGTQQVALPASELPSGVYMVQLVDEYGIRKLIKWVKQ